MSFCKFENGNILFTMPAHFKGRVYVRFRGDSKRSVQVRCNANVLVSWTTCPNNDPEPNPRPTIPNEWTYQTVPNPGAGTADWTIEPRYENGICAGIPLTAQQLFNADLAEEVAVYAIPGFKYISQWQLQYGANYIDVMIELENDGGGN